jgi:hypothetical protein
MKKIILILTLLLIGTGLLGCTDEEAIQDQVSTGVALAMEATEAVEATQAQSTDAAASKTAAVTPTFTVTLTPSLSPSLTPSPSPTETVVPSETPTEVPSETPIGYIPEDAVWFYLILLGTGGKVGCGDDMLKLWTGHIRTGNISVDLTNALNTVFSVGGYSAGGYNATYPSNLRVKEVVMEADGTAHVYFDGSFVPPKDSCDASRFRSQVWGTALQFPEVKRFIPWIGDKLLGDRLAAYSDSGK